MDLPPLPIDVTLNQQGDRAILHINCPSDGMVERWMEGGEEAGVQARDSWLWKLGCLVRMHRDIGYTFNNPWAHKISDFPANYKLFAVERQVQGDNLPRKDYYLYGGKYRYRSPQEFYPHLHWLLDNALGVRKKCICQYCDHNKKQEEINEIFPLPQGKKSAKQPRRPKHQQTRKLKGPKGTTIKRGLVVNRNSITTGPLATLGQSQQNYKSIGYHTSHPF